MGKGKGKPKGSKRLLMKVIKGKGDWTIIIGFVLALTILIILVYMV
jgi:hypothetical protein